MSNSHIHDTYTRTRAYIMTVKRLRNLIFRESSAFLLVLSFPSFRHGQGPTFFKANIYVILRSGKVYGFSALLRIVTHSRDPDALYNCFSRDSRMSESSTNKSRRNPLSAKR